MNLTDEQIAEKQIKDYLSQDRIEINLESFDQEVGQNEKEVIDYQEKGFFSLEVIYNYDFERETETNGSIENVHLIEIAQGYFCMDDISVHLTSDQLLKIQGKAILIC
mgnify:CR=1 FL=1